MVTIKTVGEKIAVLSPYHPDFPARARRLGGRWDAAGKSWNFDAHDEARVRSLCISVYGTDGSPAAQGDLVTLRAEYISGTYESKGGIYLAGRCIGSATGRDSGARLGAGIVLLAGSVRSDGSVKNWLTKINAGTIVLIRDVPRAAAEKSVAESTSTLRVSIDVAEQAPTAPLPRDGAALIATARAALAALTTEERRALLAENNQNPNALPGDGPGVFRGVFGETIGG